MPPSAITLTTDFGWTELPAAIRGVIRQIAPPETEIVDITHSVPPQSIIQGAYAMLTVCPIYKNAIHLGVVDPGVGTKRRAIVVETEGGLLIGPDNGMLAPLAHRLKVKRIFWLNNSKYWRVPVSATFHGRDIFAPVAAHLAAGVPLESVGAPAEAITTLHEFDYRETAEAIEAFVVNVDPFGNLVTSIPAKVVAHLLEQHQRMELRIGGLRVRAHPAYTYGEIEGKAFGLIANSADFVEIAVHNGSAAERLGVEAGAPVRMLRKAA